MIYSIFFTLFYPVHEMVLILVYRIPWRKEHDIKYILHLILSCRETVSILVYRIPLRKEHDIGLNLFFILYWRYMVSFDFRTPWE